MAVPTTEKTWEFSLFNFCDPQTYYGATSDEGSARVMYLAFLNFMTDKLKKGWGGTWTDQGGGVARFTPTAVGGRPYSFVPNDELYNAADVGLKIVFVGCSSAGNDGEFTITAVDPSGLWCEFNVATPVYETDTDCASHVLAGNFTTPLTVKGSSASYSGRSYGMDGKDRWLSPADYDSDASGNRDWVVLQTASGCEMLWWMDTSSASYQYEWGVVGFSPEVGFTGGTLSTSPTASDYREVSARATSWGPYDAPYASGDFYVSVMMSSDGEHFRFWHNGSGYQNLYAAMEPVMDAITTGPLIPWNGGQNVATWHRQNNVSSVMSFAQYNDSARLYATVDKDGTAGGPYITSYYLTAEMLASAMLGEYMGSVPNELDRHISFAPMGLMTTSANVSGRHGRMADLWWVGAKATAYGNTFPFDGSKDFIRIGDFILPWDGATNYKRRV